MEEAETNEKLKALNKLENCSIMILSAGLFMGLRGQERERLNRLSPRKIYAHRQTGALSLVSHGEAILSGSMAPSESPALFEAK